MATYSLIVLFILNGALTESVMLTHQSSLSCHTFMREHAPALVESRGIDEYALMCVVRNKA